MMSTYILDTNIYLQNPFFKSLSEEKLDKLKLFGISFTFRDSDVVVSCCNNDIFNKCLAVLKPLSKIFTNSYHRKRRELTRSSGMYTQADLNELYEIQEGKCFFTGESLAGGKRGYSIDHIKPIREYGSSWPGNLALVNLATNNEKRHLSKTQYMHVLKKRNGDAWLKKQRAIRKEIDIKRKSVDRRRKKEVKSLFKHLEKELQEEYPGHKIVYELNQEHPTILFDDIEVNLPVGMLRKSKCFTIKYIAQILIAISNKSLIKEDDKYYRKGMRISTYLNKIEDDLERNEFDCYFGHDVLYDEGYVVISVHFAYDIWFPINFAKTWIKSDCIEYFHEIARAFFR
ncbi:hypothetical protein MNBD_GAMMA12-571 [hydrothermal vent metagenome]|uniref:Uncharacterized protein n=1 Tax=hydrothermal vent metagenome TaxID=652676 RepID=A0A3B0Z0Z2_9ZZZZ